VAAAWLKMRLQQQGIGVHVLNGVGLHAPFFFLLSKVADGAWAKEALTAE